MTKDQVLDAFLDLIAEKVAEKLEQRAKPAIGMNVSKPTDKPATEKQVSLLRSWRNQGQLRAALASVTGNGTTDVEDLSAKEASAVLDFMLPPRKGTTRAYAS